MDLLETLQQKREVNRRRMHPLYSLSLNERYIYCFGLAILAKGNIKTIKELSQPFAQICSMLDISKASAEEMIVDINNHFEPTLDRLIQLLSIEQRMYSCFLIDMLKLKMKSEWGSWYCEEVIRQFCYILKLPDETAHFFEEFLLEAAFGDSNRAHQLVKEYEQAGHTIDYELLCYMNQEYQKQDKYQNMLLDKGGRVRIECPTRVEQDIVVKNGTKLYISNTRVEIGGRLIIEDGQVEICNATLEAVGKKREMHSLLLVRQVHSLKLKEVTINCNKLCYGIWQEEGTLILDQAVVCQSVGEYGVLFDGECLFCTNSTFHDCLHGGIHIRQNADVDIIKTHFINCSAEHGGAIHSSTKGRAVIRECYFRQCTARYLGADVYFKYKRYGQVVQECYFEDEEPDKNHLFNVYNMERVI